jgi:hypothetical protein
VPHPLGFENLFSVDDIIRAIAAMRAEKPTIRSVIAKLNEGVSGMGNAVIDLENLPPPGDPTEPAAIGERLKGMHCELEDATYDSYVDKVVEKGAVVEELIAGQEFRSPSAQLRASPLGQLELLSTHDQMLGGDNGQQYAGGRFPAAGAYHHTIVEPGGASARTSRSKGQSADSAWTSSSFARLTGRGGLSQSS